MVDGERARGPSACFPDMRVCLSDILGEDEIGVGW